LAESATSGTAVVTLRPTHAGTPLAPLIATLRREIADAHEGIIRRLDLIELAVGKLWKRQTPHYLFLSHEADVLREIRSFLTLPAVTTASADSAACRLQSRCRHAG
jgi:hypothetical protein